MAKAKYLTDADNNKIYPVGHTKAVYDETGTVLEDRLKKSEDKVNNLKDVALSGDYNDLTNKPTSMKPTSHASTSDTYGKGDSTNYGHVKLSSSTNSTSGTSSGEAATPSTVKAAYDLASGKMASSTKVFFSSNSTNNRTYTIILDGGGNTVNGWRSAIFGGSGTEVNADITAAPEQPGLPPAQQATQ